jgi:ankyrin repeat protein
MIIQQLKNYIILDDTVSLKNFLETKKKIDIQNNNEFILSNVLLPYAIKHKSYKSAKLLVHQFKIKISLNLQTKSIFFQAIKENNLEQIKMLTMAGININIINNQTNNGLMNAIINKRTDIIKYFMSLNPDLERINVNGDNALMLSAINNKFTIFQMLLKATSNLDHINVRGNNLLLLAARNSDESIFEYLVDNFIFNLNYRNKAGQTALHVAVMHKRTKIIRILLLNKANVDAQDRYGNTALMYSINYKQFQIVNWLIVARSNLNLRNARNENAFHIAFHQGFIELAFNFLEKSVNPLPTQEATLSVNIINNSYNKILKYKITGIIISYKKFCLLPNNPTELEFCESFSHYVNKVDKDIKRVKLYLSKLYGFNQLSDDLINYIWHYNFEHSMFLSNNLRNADLNPENNLPIAKSQNIIVYYNSMFNWWTDRLIDGDHDNFISISISYNNWRSMQGNSDIRYDSSGTVLAPNNLINYITNTTIKAKPKKHKIIAPEPEKKYFKNNDDSDDSDDFNDQHHQQNQKIFSPLISVSSDSSSSSNDKNSYHDYYFNHNALQIALFAACSYFLHTTIIGSTVNIPLLGEIMPQQADSLLTSLLV